MRRVLVEHLCGEACHVRWQLYDPTTKEFFDYASGQRSRKPIDEKGVGNMSDAWIPKSGEAFLLGGQIWTFGGAAVFKDGQKSGGGGWIGGQWYVN